METLNVNILAIGLMVIVTGFLMRLVKPNFVIGIRVPWTLNNEEVWRKTHLLSGYLFIASGILIIIFSIFFSRSLMAVLAPGMVGLAIVIALFYSFTISKRKRHQ